jgi:vacuolar-type H+-ATPase subunit I/STV1
MVLVMGYRAQSSPKSSGRGHQWSPHEKKKAKGKKHRSSGKYLLEEEHVPTSEEVVEKTLDRLRSLGNQTFAVSPFSAYFDDWLMSLKDVLVAFESNPSVSVDEQFVKERAQILADAERELEERRRKEISLGEAIKSLSDNKSLLERIQTDYAEGVREIERRKNSEIKRLNGSIAVFRGELDDLAKVKAGLFRAVSKKAKAQKKADLTQKLNAAQKELELTVPRSAAEQESLRSEYEKRKQLVTEQIGKLQKEVEGSEVDGSLATRRVACEALVNAVNALLQRKAF